MVVYLFGAKFSVELWTVAWFILFMLLGSWLIYKYVFGDLLEFSIIFVEYLSIIILVIPLIVNLLEHQNDQWYGQWPFVYKASIMSSILNFCYAAYSLISSNKPLTNIGEFFYNHRKGLLTISIIMFIISISIFVWMIFTGSKPFVDPFSSLKYIR